jgi:hypothetical protein
MKSYDLGFCHDVFSPRDQYFIYLSEKRWFLFIQIYLCSGDNTSHLCGSSSPVSITALQFEEVLLYI